MAYDLSDLDEVDVNFMFLKPDGSEGDIDLSDPPTLESSDPNAATGTLSGPRRSPRKRLRGTRTSSC